ncbi:uncharacterized protein LOC133184044 [Saccostrea echinata]|uniref:uncharacterized protein LOC133184044 n=1 Tax=Saccostrea echinata TaxID=191078 RepID=UPI002A7FBB83|nr:uncharacterized protein LOC133184044 [Saccostrea echinata]
MAEFSPNSSNSRSFDYPQGPSRLRRTFSTSSPCRYCGSGNNCENDCSRTRMNELIQLIREDILFESPTYPIRLKMCKDKIRQLHLEIFEDAQILEPSETSSSSSFESVSGHFHDTSDQTSEIRRQTDLSDDPKNRRRLSPVREKEVGRHAQGLAQHENPRQIYYEHERQPHSYKKYQQRHQDEDLPYYQTENEYKSRRIIKETQPYYSEIWHTNPERRDTTSMSGKYQYNLEKNESNDLPVLLRLGKSKPIKDMCATKDSVYICDGSNFYTELTNGLQKEMPLAANANFIAMSPKAVYFANCQMNTVMKFENGETSLLYSSQEWALTGLTNRDNNIYICMYNKWKMQGRIVMISKEGTKLVEEKEIEYDRHDNKIFEHPKFIALNSKDEMCVSDIFRKCVVVLNNNGIIRLKYAGPFSGKTDEFQPEGLSCDDFDNLYVADNNNNSIDIVNPSGHWMRSIVNIPSPVCVTVNDKKICITMDEECYVGCILVYPI